MTFDGTDNEKLQAIADHLVNSACVPQSFVPSGYDIHPGDRVLLAVNSFYDGALVDAVHNAIIKAGATVDIFVKDMGEERELQEIDEFKGFIYNWKDIQPSNEIRNWSAREPMVDTMALEGGYDQLIHGVGQAPKPTSYKSDTIPWTAGEIFDSAMFPREVWDLVEAKGWDMIYNKGRGGSVRITDPEGTDITFPLHEEFFDMSRYEGSGFKPFFNPKPFFCHYWACPTPPYTLENWDVNGVCAGHLNHFSCPYPTIKVYIEHGKVAKVEGGGDYGQEWREILEATKDIQYPGYPDKGLFWFWEVGIGTNPKMGRPSNAFMLSGCGTTFERLRSGYIHFGIGSMPLSDAEAWAKENGLPYGHLHVHILQSTYEITTKDGEKLYLIKDGHMTALDDPEVREVAAKYGDPDEILKETWIPEIAGVNAPGDYEKDFAPDPLAWLKKREAEKKGE